MPIWHLHLMIHRLFNTEMTVYRFLSLPKRQRQKDLEIALQQAGVSGLGKQQLSTLSGGQFQRVRQELDWAIMMVSHELHTVMRTSDRVICLNQSICCEGSPDVVRVAPEYRLLFGLDDDEMFANYRHHDHITPDSRKLFNVR
jgi:zinc transport system ATP-binding protein